MGKIDIRFMTKYGGGVKCEVYIDDVRHTLEMEEAERVLLKAMTERGYQKTLAPRQQFERIKIND